MLSFEYFLSSCSFSILHLSSIKNINQNKKKIIKVKWNSAFAPCYISNSYNQEDTHKSRKKYRMSLSGLHYNFSNLEKYCSSIPAHTDSLSQRKKPGNELFSLFSLLLPLSPPSAPIVDHSKQHLSPFQAFTSWLFERQQSCMTCQIELYYSEGTLCLCERALVHASSPLSTGALLYA